MSFAVAEGRLCFRDGLCVMTVLVHVSLFVINPYAIKSYRIYTTNDGMFMKGIFDEERVVNVRANVSFVRAQLGASTIGADGPQRSSDSVSR